MSDNIFSLTDIIEQEKFSIVFSRVFSSLSISRPLHAETGNIRTIVGVMYSTVIFLLPRAYDDDVVIQHLAKKKPRRDPHVQTTKTTLPHTHQHDLPPLNVLVRHLDGNHKNIHNRFCLLLCVWSTQTCGQYPEPTLSSRH